jgi:valyl-tRNA synthetase
MLRKLAAATTAIEEAFASYQFNAAADVLYDIIWRDFCDWYLEAIKHTVRDDPKQQQVLLTVLDVLLRLAHPICPFVTETLWPAVQHAGRSGVAGVTCPPAPLLAGGDWPDVEPPEGTGADLFEQARAIITAIRRVRSDNAVGQRRMITLLADDATAQVISLANGVVEAMAGLESVLPLSESTAQDVAVGDGECRLRGLTDEVDPAQRRGAAQDAVEECRKKVVALQARMENPAYVERAPAHLVQETRDQLSHALEALATSEEALEACSDE